MKIESFAIHCNKSKAQVKMYKMHFQNACLFSMNVCSIYTINVQYLIAACLLTEDQVKDIQNYASGRQYIIIRARDTIQVFNNSDAFRMLYLFTIRNQNSIQGNIKIWFSHVLSPTLTQLFRRFLSPSQNTGTRTVTLYFENLIYPLINDNQDQSYPLPLEVNHSVYGAMSCLECLVSQGYNVGDWNWQTFSADTSTASCSYYTEMYNNRNYKNVKALMNNYMSAQPNSISLKNLCCSSA